MQVQSLERDVEQAKSAAVAILEQAAEAVTQREAQIKRPAGVRIQTAQQAHASQRSQLERQAAEAEGRTAEAEGRAAGAEAKLAEAAAKVAELQGRLEEADAQLARAWSDAEQAAAAATAAEAESRAAREAGDQGTAAAGAEVRRLSEELQRVSVAGCSWRMRQDAGVMA